MRLALRAFLLAAAGVLVVATTGSVRGEQTMDYRLPNVSIVDWLDHPKETKVVNQGEQNEFVNINWVNEQESQLHLAGGVTEPYAFVIEQWGHRENFDSDGDYMGPYVGDSDDWDNDIIGIIQGTSNKMHYAFVRAGNGAKTSVLGMGAIATFGQGDTLGDWELVPRAVRRGKDQKNLHCHIGNTDKGKWTFEWESKLKMKAGGSGSDTDLLGHGTPVIDAEAYGRLRVFLDREIVDYDDGFVRRTTRVEEDMIDHDIQTQYGTIDDGGWTEAITDSQDRPPATDPTEDNFRSIYDVASVDSRTEKEYLSALFTYSSYGSVIVEADKSETGGSGQAYAKVTHGMIGMSGIDELKGFRDGASEDDFKDGHFWDVLVEAYWEKYPGVHIFIKDFRFE